jgi:hypothetical protein
MESLNLRPATPADVPQILAFIRDLAAYEREPDAVHATEADLLRDGFGEPKRFDCLIAELNEDGIIIPAGFALYFHNYSTWRGHAGIYLEDLYVNPEQSPPHSRCRHRRSRRLPAPRMERPRLESALHRLLPPARSRHEV